MFGSNEYVSLKISSFNGSAAYAPPAPRAGQLQPTQARPCPRRRVPAPGPPFPKGRLLLAVVVAQPAPPGSCLPPHQHHDGGAHQHHSFATRCPHLRRRWRRAARQWVGRRRRARCWALRSERRPAPHHQPGRQPLPLRARRARRRSRRPLPARLYHELAKVVQTRISFTDDINFLDSGDLIHANIR